MFKFRNRRKTSKTTKFAVILPLLATLNCLQEPTPRPYLTVLDLHTPKTEENSTDIKPIKDIKRPQKELAHEEIEELKDIEDRQEPKETQQISDIEHSETLDLPKIIDLSEQETMEEINCTENLIPHLNQIMQQGEKVQAIDSCKHLLVAKIDGNFTKIQIIDENDSILLEISGFLNLTSKFRINGILWQVHVMPAPNNSVLVNLNCYNDKTEKTFGCVGNF